MKFRNHWNYHRPVGFRIALAAACLFLALATLRAEDASPQNEEQKLISVLKSDAELFEKAKACQKLAVFGGKEAVPVLASFLGHEKLAHYARFGLEPNPDPSVDAALRDALNALNGDLLIGVINSIGARRDAQALGSLVPLLGGSETEVAKAAAAAIGRIGTPRSAKILRESLAKSDGELRRSIAAACLPCAEALIASGKEKVALRTYQSVRRAKKVPRHIKMAALRGLLLTRGSDGLPILVKTLEGKSEPAFNIALIAVREVQGDRVTEGIVATLDQLPARRQAKLISALGERGDRKALPKVLELAKNDQANVRIAAIRSLRTLGDASAVPVLIEVGAHADAETAKIAQETLANLPGKTVDSALLARLAEGGQDKFRPVVFEAVGQRGLRSAVPTLQKAALESTGEIRLAAIGALGQTVTLEELSILTNALSKTETADEKSAVLEALKSAAGRMHDGDACTKKLVQAMAVAEVEERCLILEVFAEFGGASALEAVASSAKDPDDRIRGAATKVLGNWQSEKAAHTLLVLLESSTDSADRILVLGAFSGLVRRLGFRKEERIGVCKQAMALSKVDAERKIVIHTLAGIPAPESLQILATHLADPGLREAACQASITICERIVRSRRGAVVRSMRQVFEATENAELKKRAEVLLRQAGGKP